MLELKNISLSLLQNGRPLVEDFSFVLNRGEKAVIIGEEGDGKSTLLQYICDPALVSPYCEYSGTVLKKGTAAYLPQRMDEREFSRPLEAYFAGTDLYAHTTLLTQLGLTPDFLLSSQAIGTLSGGERVKIQLARLLMARPDILLLDEPTNDIDMATLRFLERFLQRSPLTILYISHDETLIENTASILLHMEQLRRKSVSRTTVFYGSYGDYLAQRRSAFQKQAQVAQKQRDDYQKQLDRWQQIHDRVEHEQRANSRQDPHSGRLMKKKMKSVLAQGRRFEREAEDFLDFPDEEEAIFLRFDGDIALPAGKRVLELELPELRAGGRLLARELRLTVTGPAHIGITGRNGAGKSTLLEEIWTQLRERRDLRACYMPQDYARALDGRLSAVEYLAAHYSKEEMTRARRYLGNMRFTSQEMTNPMNRLSGGQQAKILFLEMVLRRADVLLLDEPTRNFSPLSCPVIRQTLRDFGGAVLSVSHDRKFLSQVCNLVYVLDENGLHQRAPEEFSI